MGAYWSQPVVPTFSQALRSLGRRDVGAPGGAAMDAAVWEAITAPTDAPQVLTLNLDPKT